MTSGVFAQGLINFFNNANTLVSAYPGTPISAPVGSFYFGLLTSTNISNFTFSGVYGTNQAVAGRFTGGANVQVAGWAPGTSRYFEVVGWSASLGPTFNPSWFFSTPNATFFGSSAIGSGLAGGFNGTGTLPNLNIFGGATGIQSGFALLTPVPEPSATSLAVAGGILLVIHRRVRRGASLPEVQTAHLG
jgi:hypothetical protein